jgi:hypothetical protein
MAAGIVEPGSQMGLFDRMGSRLGCGQGTLFAEPTAMLDSAGEFAHAGAKGLSQERIRETASLRVRRRRRPCAGELLGLREALTDGSRRLGPMFIGPLLAASGLALIHLFSSNLRFLDTIPRSRWLSVAGGVSVAFVMLHLLPQLHALAPAIGAAWDPVMPRSERLIYALALGGLVAFYGLEQVARKAKRVSQEKRLSQVSRVSQAPQVSQGSQAPQVSQAPQGSVAEEWSRMTFWLHMTSYAIYNSLVGYLLVREERDGRSLALFFIAIGMHMVINDYSLQKHHRGPYRRLGRWLLSAAILIGCGVGMATEIDPLVTASILGVLAGGILLNTFKEELPAEKESRYWAFALGAALSAAIMLST